VKIPRGSMVAGESAIRATRQASWAYERRRTDDHQLPPARPTCARWL